VATFAAKGIVYGHWRDQLKEVGINTLTDTAAQFGASQIGAGRKVEIEHDLKAGTTDLYNYLSHKISHAALGAATRAAHTKLSGGNRKEVRKAAKGGAIGAASAEMLAEAMMPSAVQRIQTQLETEGLSPSSASYGDRRQELLSAELKNLKACGEIAAVITAQAIGGDLEAAQLAARNALTYNSSQVLRGVALLTGIADAPDFHEEHKQAEEAEKELEEDLRTLEEVQEEQKLLQRGRYRPTQGGDASVTEDVSALLFDVSTRNKRIANEQTIQATNRNMRDLVIQHGEAIRTKNYLAATCSLSGIENSTQLDMVGRAQQALAPSSPPPSILVGETSSSSLMNMTMVGAGTTIASNGLASQAPLSRAMALRMAAITGGEATLGGAAVRGLTFVPKDPRFWVGAVVAAGVGYGGHLGYEYYKETQLTLADRAKAYREDLKQGYNDLLASRGQDWMAQNTPTYTSLANLYTPTTEKGRGIFVDPRINTYSVPTEPMGWVDPGFDTHPGEVKILSTPIPEPSKPILEGFDRASVNIGGILEGFDPAQFGNSPLEGFDRYQGPDMAILTMARNSGESKEISIRCKSLEEARNRALQEIGQIDIGSRELYYGRLGVGKGKIIGFETTSNGTRKVFRWDYDEVKGPHINIEIGKGSNRIKKAFQFPGTETDIAKIIQRLMKDNH
jgi:hypothetical protein